MDKNLFQFEIVASTQNNTARWASPNSLKLNKLKKNTAVSEDS